MKDIYSKLKNKEEKLAVVGLGYVGMPLAVAFAEKFQVTGFDTNSDKIAQYKDGRDLTHEVGDEKLSKSQVFFTDDEKNIQDAVFITVAVPTPINGDKTPDLTPVIEASRTVGRNLKKGAIVVYESTVYPGVTEKVCVPVLEQESGLICGEDFKVGYSPERINPGDKQHPLKSIRKIVSGMDEETLEQVRKVYNSIIEAGTYPVSSIKTAEAVKVVENSQRDINIAFMNEMAMAFEHMGIDTNEVVDGMNTKWNALGFRPGLVGGHCISVDPYYFIYEAELQGYTSQIVAAGRRINDYMGAYVGKMTIKQMIRSKINPSQANVVILGITFKENCPDIRNTKVMDVINKLREYDIEPKVTDPQADPQMVKNAYGIDLVPLNEVKNADCIIHAVSHKEFAELGTEGLLSLFRQETDTDSSTADRQKTDPAEKSSHGRVLIDVKGQWPVQELESAGVTVWRL